MRWSNNNKLMFMLVGLGVAVVLGGGIARADFTFGTPIRVLDAYTFVDEWASSISFDGLSLYFTSEQPGGSGDWDIWVTTRASVSDPWGSPVNLGSTVNSSRAEMNPSISSDGLSLYFSDGAWITSRPRPGGFGSADLWVTTRSTLDDDWGRPVNLGSIVNSAATEGVPSISSDDLSLFYESNRPGGSGTHDIWMTNRDIPDGEWGTPMNLGPVINSSGLDVHADISSDGLALFFQSNRSGGSLDLWITKRVAVSEPFGPPVRIGPMIETSGLIEYPNTSTDGWTLFFSSSADWFLWQVPIIPIVDFNCDGIVDTADMYIIVNHWGQNYSLSDIGPKPWGDGIVDVQDLILLSEHLFEEVPLPGELVAYWKLNEEEGDSAFDSVGDNTGLLFGGPLWRLSEGKRDGALQFDGIDDYISTDFVLDPSLGAFSILVWVKGGAPGQVIISQSDGIGTGETWLGMDALGGNLMTGLVPPPVGRFRPKPLESEFVITDDRWHHIGLVFHGSYRSLYVDGTKVATDTAVIAPLKSSNGGLYIGTSNTLDAGTFFSGLVDDVRIYNQALSVEHIEALAQ